MGLSLASMLLARHLRVGDDELDSMLRMIATHLDASRSAIAGHAADDDGDGGDGDDGEVGDA